MEIKIRSVQVTTVIISLLISCSAWADSLWECRKPIAPNEVRVFEMPNYSGRCKSFKLEPHMRNLLVPYGANFYRKGKDRRWSVKAGKEVLGLFFSYTRWSGYTLLTFTNMASVNDKMDSLIVFPRKKRHPDGVSLVYQAGRLDGVRAFFPMPQSKTKMRLTLTRRLQDITQAKIILYGNVAVQFDYWDSTYDAKTWFKHPTCCSVILPTPNSKSKIFYAQDYDIKRIKSGTVVASIQRSTLEKSSKNKNKSVAKPTGTKGPLDRLKCKRIKKNPIGNRCFKNTQGTLYRIKPNSQDQRKFTFTGGSEKGSGYICNGKAIVRWQTSQKKSSVVGKLKSEPWRGVTGIYWDNQSAWQRYPCK